MNLRILEYFLVVADLGNITRAAETLMMTQPTLSRQLKQLEEELGCALFRRKNHHIELTEEGRLFRRRAQELLDLAEKAKQELQTEETLTGEVVIGYGGLQAVKEVSQIVAGFHQRHPEVHFRLVTGDNLSIREGLDQGMLDFGLLLDPTEKSHYDYVRLTTTEEWGVLLSTQSPLAQQAGIVQGDLLGMPVITIHDRQVQQELVSWAGSTARQMRNFARYQMLSAVLDLARQTQAPVVCLRPAETYQDLVFVPLSPRLEAHSILAWKTQPVTSQLLQAFRNFLRETYK